MPGGDGPACRHGRGHGRSAHRLSGPSQRHPAGGEPGRPVGHDRRAQRGRLEVGLGVSSSFARLDYDALGLPYPPWPERLENYRSAIKRLQQLTGPDTVLAARPAQTPLPLILGGNSPQVRALARDHGLAWNYSAGDRGSVEEFRRLSQDQPDPQVQLFLARTPQLTRQLDEYAAAGATRTVVVLTPPITPGDIDRVSRLAGLR